MKIYEVEFKNLKYIGESNRNIEVKALTLCDAVDKAQNYIVKNKEDFSNLGNWTAIRSELVAETVN